MLEDRRLPMPELGLLRRYLQTLGWRRETTKISDLDLFTIGYQKSPNAEIILPRTVGVPDTTLRIYQALKILSGYTGRTLADISSEVSMFDFDIIRMRLPDEVVMRASIRLRTAEKFIANTRRFLASAAAAVQENALTVRDAHRVGAAYAEECRLGHTFPGSFGFTVESPAGPLTGQYDDKLKPPPPYQRRIVERIAMGVSQVQYAAEIKDLKWITDNASNGLNADMLADFLSLVADSSASDVIFDFTFTPAWPPVQGVPRITKVTTATLSLIEDAIKVLQPPAKAENETVLGTVIRLETRENPADLFHHEGSREVTLDGVSRRAGPVTVKVRLTPQEYLLAVEAHKAGKEVTVSGKLERTSRGSFLREPFNFGVR